MSTTVTTQGDFESFTAPLLWYLTVFAPETTHFKTYYYSRTLPTCYQLFARICTTFAKELKKQNNYKS